MGICIYIYVYMLDSSGWVLAGEENKEFLGIHTYTYPKAVGFHNYMAYECRAHIINDRGSKPGGGSPQTSFMTVKHSSRESLAAF